MISIATEEHVASTAYTPRPLIDPGVTPRSPVFDMSSVLPKFSWDLSAIVRAASIYVDNAPHLMAAMYTSVQQGDADGLRKMACKLRTAADALCAERAREIAYSIEQACQFCDPCLLRPAVDDCLAEVASLRAALKRIAGESGH